MLICDDTEDYPICTNADGQRHQRERAVNPGFRRSRRNRRIIRPMIRGKKEKLPEIAISDQLSAFGKAVFG